MKFKKAFAWILAVAMVITLMPSMAFATSTNTVRAVPTVASNEEMPETSISVEVKDNNWNENGSMKSQTIKLNFTNAKWTKNPTEGAISANVITPDVANPTKNFRISVDGDTATNATFSKVNVVSDNSIEFEFSSTDPIVKGDVFTFTFGVGALKSGSENGPVEISIDSLDSYLSSSNLTVATVGSNNTVATVNGSTKTYGRVVNNPVDTTIEIREAAVNSITGNQTIKFTLPKGMSWDGMKIGGNLFTTSGFTPDSNGEIKFTSPETRLIDVNAPGKYWLGNDGRSLYICLQSDRNDSVRQVATFKPYITIDKNASEGDILVDITSHEAFNNSNGVSDASELVIGIYGTESVKVTTTAEEKLPVIYSGYELTNKDKNTYVQLTIEESVRDSLSGGRYIDVEFPEAIQVRKDINNGTNNGIKTTLDKNPDIGDANTFPALSTNYVKYGDSEQLKDNSSFTLTVPDSGNIASSGNAVNWSTDKANKWTLFIPVTIRADFTGDIEATLKGPRAGIDETKIVVGKAESPITVTAKTTEVRNGVQSQALADITITENVAGYLDLDREVVLRLDTLDLTGTSLTSAKAEVTEGDLEIKDVKRDKNTLTFTIKEESTKASTISVTGVVAALNRTLPEGPYALQVYGNALVQNGNYNDGDFHDPKQYTTSGGNSVAENNDGDVYAATVADYIKIVTPADPSTMENKINAVFVLRQDTFTNNGETVKMDTAPYLDANNRTQLPIRYAAIACGVDEKDISWDQASQTATINGKNVVLRITIGSNIMQTSNGPITMDTAAVSSNGRIFVPIRYIANALGAEVGWNYDTKTITLTN